jgi:SM-20-related protein
MSDYLNPATDPAVVNANYLGTGRVVMPDFLQPDFAAAIEREMIEQQDWNLVFRDNNRHYDLHRIQWQALTDDNYRQLRERIIAFSQHNFQYWYYNIPMYDMVAEGRPLSPNLQLLYQLLQSPDFIALMRQFTGVQELDFADCQATRYTDGSFLTTHDDEVTDKNRYCAYVLGLTQDWQADWGGLLTFPDKENREGEYFLPGFNSLSLFSVPQPHFVSMVNPMAQRARLSITGWLRSHSSKP